MIRTIEAILGLEPSSLFSAAAAPMTEVFDLNQATWSYRATVPGLLRQSELPLLPPTPRALASAREKHNVASS